MGKAEPAGSAPHSGRGWRIAPAALLKRCWRRWFLDNWAAIDAEAAAERAALGHRFDARPLWVLVLVALVLVFQEYWGDRTTFTRLMPQLAAGHWGRLGEFAWWSGAKVLGYLVVPALALRLAGIRLRDCGLDPREASKHVRIYLALLAAVTPIVVIASYDRNFQATYPFYRCVARSWTDLLAWEALYALSFVAVEFFFRGFMLFALRRAMGANAIFVMIVPYCMVHFSKPVEEVVASIFTGVILGTLALRTRSIWGGVAIHVAVAMSMDLLAIFHADAFPRGDRLVRCR